MKGIKSNRAGWIITLAVIILVGGRYLWILHTQPSQRQKEIAAAFGSVALFYGSPQPDHAGNRVTYVGTADVGFGVMLVDVASGRKRNVRQPEPGTIEPDTTKLVVWPWSPDDRSFIYSDTGKIAVCDADEGKVTAEIKIPTSVAGLSWLTPTSLACLGANGDLYQFQKQADGTWGRKPASLVVRSTGGTASASSEDKAGGATAGKAFEPGESPGWSSGDTTNAWLQYHFDGPAWAITHYTLTSSPDHADAAPRDWQLLGSDDGANWILLDTRQGEIFTAHTQTKSYSLTNEAPYWYYRLNITGAAGGESGVRLAKFQLWSEDTRAVASANAENTPNQTAAAAFDGSTRTKWFNGFAPLPDWLQYQFGGGAAWAFSEYSVTSANDLPDRDPEGWDFQASNDGKSWVTLDRRADERFASRLLTKSYVFKNTTPYRYYRLLITASEPTIGGPMQLSELHFGPSNDTNTAASAAIVANPFSGAVSLATLDPQTVAWGQRGRLWTMNLNSNVPVLLLDLAKAASGNTTLRGFRYSEKTGHYLLSCGQRDGGGSLWLFNPDDGAAGLRQISTQEPGAIQETFWTDGPSDSWIGQQSGLVVTGHDTSCEPMRGGSLANVDTLGVSGDGKRVFAIGTKRNEPSSGLWRFDLASPKLQIVVPYADHPSLDAETLNEETDTARSPSGLALHYDIYAPPEVDEHPHRKYPLLIGNTQFGVALRGVHGRLWVPALAASGVYVVIINRDDWWKGLDQWGENVTTVYNQIANTLPIDKSRVFLFSVSIETIYMSQFMTNSPGLWRGAILLNPTGLPDLSSAPSEQRRPRILISAGGLEHEEVQFQRLQTKALNNGVAVDLVISPGEGHHFVGNAAQLERTEAMLRFIEE